MVIWNKFRHNYFTLCVLGIDPRTIFILFLLQLLNLKLKNMRLFLFVLALLLNTWVGISQSVDEKRLEEDLFALPDVSFTKISSANELPIKYMLRIKQPLDHKDRSKGEFYQRVILTHQGYQQPTLMQTQGYELYKGKNELEAALKANHINIIRIKKLVKDRGLPSFTDPCANPFIFIHGFKQLIDLVKICRYLLKSQVLPLYRIRYRFAKITVLNVEVIGFECCFQFILSFVQLIPLGLHQGGLLVSLMC